MNSASDSEEHERKKRKPRRKKRLKGLPNKIHVFKNKDKSGWYETWDKPANRSPGHLCHPFRLLALGRPGGGKTNTMINLFLKHQASSKKFKKLYIVTCDSSSQEWLDLEPDCVLTEIPDLDIFDGSEKTCIILDDIELVARDKIQQKRLSTLMRFTSSHKNCSVMLGFQSFFDTPPIARKCCNVFLLYKGWSKQETAIIENRVGVDTGVLQRLYQLCTKQHDSIMIDKSPGTPYPFRKNVYEIIDVENLH
jgi:hypothetical protein